MLSCYVLELTIRTFSSVHDLWVETQIWVVTGHRRTVVCVRFDNSTFGVDRPGVVFFDLQTAEQKSRNALAEVE